MTTLQSEILKKEMKQTGTLKSKYIDGLSTTSNCISKKIFLHLFFSDTSVKQIKKAGIELLILS